MKTLEQQLAIKVRKFSFIKKDGSLRIALGTLNPKIMEAALGSYTPRGSRSANTTPYFDMEAMDFRCFITDNFKEFLDDPNNAEEDFF